MTLSVERAAKGHRKSMAALYEAYKTSLYSFCCILMDDTQKAEIAVTRTVRAIWSQLSVKHAQTEEDFRRLLLMEAVRICRAMLFGKDSRGFKVSKIEPVELPAFSETAYTGDVEAGMETLQAVLETVGPHRRFIYLLHAAGGLSFAEIAAVIRQRGARPRPEKRRGRNLACRAHAVAARTGRRAHPVPRRARRRLPAADSLQRQTPFSPQKAVGSGAVHPSRRGDLRIRGAGRRLRGRRFIGSRRRSCGGERGVADLRNRVGSRLMRLPRLPAQAQPVLQFVHRLL